MKNYKNDTTLYIGVKGFTSKYNLTKLIYYEEYPQAKDAITREKQLKNWHRDWKFNLIRELNPDLKELDAEINSA